MDGLRWSNERHIRPYQRSVNTGNFPVAHQERLSQARAYRETRVLLSRGEAKRFEALLTEYKRAPEVTWERLYLETLESILPRMEKVIIEEGHAEKVLPYLPIGRRGVGQ